MNSGKLVIVKWLETDIGSEQPLTSFSVITLAWQLSKLIGSLITDFTPGHQRERERERERERVFKAFKTHSVIRCGLFSCSKHMGFEQLRGSGLFCIKIEHLSAYLRLLCTQQGFTKHRLTAVLMWALHKLTVISHCLLTQ